MDSSAETTVSLLISTPDLDFTTNNIELMVIQEYITPTDTQITQKIIDLERKIKEELLYFKSSVEPPYISQVYGKIREKCYNEYMNCLGSFSGSKDNKYKALFYRELDLNFQQQFEDSISIKWKYSQYIIEKGLKVSSFKVKESINLADMTDTDIDSLKAEVLDLSIEWYICIDRAVDGLARCNLYGLSQDTDYRKMYAKLKEKYRLERRRTWGEWIPFGFNWGVHKIGENFREKMLPKKDEEGSIEKLLMMVACVAGNHLISEYEREKDYGIQKKRLIEIKNFLQDMIERLKVITVLIYKQIEKCLLAQTKSEISAENIELEGFIENLLNLQGDFTLLNEKLLKIGQEQISEGFDTITTPLPEEPAITESIYFTPNTDQLK